MNVNPYIKIFYDNSIGKAMITNTNNSKTYVLGAFEYSVLKCIQENTPLETLDFSKFKYTRDDIEKLIVQFQELDFISDRPLHKRKIINWTKIKIHVLNPENISSRLCNILYYFFILGSIFFIIAGMINSMFHLFYGTDPRKIDFIYWNKEYDFYSFGSSFQLYFS